MNFMEKRLEKRVVAKLPVFLVTKDKPDVINNVLAFNLSLDGICVQTDLVLALDEHIELELNTPMGKIKLQAVIIWNKGNEYGCRFANMDQATKRILNQWLFPPFEP